MFTTTHSKSTTAFLSLTLLLMFGITTSSPAALADDTTPVPAPAPVDPLDAEIAKLEKQVKLSNLQKTLAENEKAIGKSQIPEISITPLDGKTTLNDKAVLEATLLSYRALTQAGLSVAKDIASYNSQQSLPTGYETQIRQLAIYNDADSKALGNFDLFLEQIAYLSKRYDSILGPPPTGSSHEKTRSALLGTAIGAQAVSGTLKSVVDVLSLFRTETTISGVDVVPDEKILVGALANGLKNITYAVRDPQVMGGTIYKPIKVFYPTVMPIQKKTKTGQQVLDFINQLQERRDEAENLKEKTASLIVTKQATKKEKEADLAKEKAKNPPNQTVVDALTEEINELAEEIETAQRQIAKITSLNDTFDKFVTALYKTDDQTAVNALAGLIKAAALNEMFQDGGYSLFLTIHKVGGNNKVKRNLFFTQAKDYYNGGARISYMLFDTDRSIKLTGSPEIYLDYVRPFALVEK